MERVSLLSLIKSQLWQTKHTGCNADLQNKRTLINQDTNLHHQVLHNTVQLPGLLSLYAGWPAKIENTEHSSKFLC